MHPNIHQRAKAARKSLYFRHPEGLLPNWKVQHLFTKKPLRGRRDIFRLTSPILGDRLVAKVYQRREAAAVQYDAMKEVSARTSLVARPNFVDTKLGVLMLDCAGGVSLQERLCRQGHEDLIRTAARWHTKFLSDTHIQFEPFQTWNLEDNLAITLRRLPSLDELQPIIDRLDDRAKELESVSTAKIFAFFDFKQANLVLSRDKLIAIDRPRTGTSIAETDLAQFLAFLEMCHATRPRWQKSRFDFARDYSAVLEVVQPSEEQRAVLRLLCDRIKLHWWLTKRDDGLTPVSHVAWLAKQVESMSEPAYKAFRLS